jgi:ORF6N domain-containing protein
LGAVENPSDSLPVLSGPSLESIEHRIYVIRGQKVMLDSDLAELYQVPTKRLNEAVRRHLNRFPADFMFRLTEEESACMRSQSATSYGRGGRRYSPYAFTEHGVAMLSSVLHSERAVEMNILIVRAFVRLRQLLATHKDLARRIEQLESVQEQYGRTQKQHASILVAVVQDIEKLKTPPTTRAIGFIARNPKKK